MNSYNPFSLAEKTILVTGASSGIGRTTAIECSKMGATLVITGRNEERLNETLSALDGEGHQAVAADLTNEEDIKRLVEETQSLDGVFFCAGVTDTTLVKFMTREKIMRVMDVNFISPALLTKQLLSKKKINKGASLVYMSSYGAEKVTPGLGIYAASKMGVNALTHAVGIEMASRHIRANSIMPMMVKTELVDNITTISKEEIEKDEAKYPFGYGKPEDVAFAAIYLLSDASRWVTGTQIRMDGGSTL